MTDFISFFRLKIRRLDWVTLICVFILATASLVSLASSDINFFNRQLIWYGIAFAVIIFGSQIDWRLLISQAWFRYGMYWLSIVLLVISNLQTKTVRGTKSWLDFGFIQFEPSELAKLSLILILAGFFSRRYVAAWHSKNILVSLFYALLPAGLIAIHPDFGSAIVVLGIWLGFLLLSGLNYKRFAVGLTLALAVAAVLWIFFLKPYQKDRVMGFVFPEADPLGINYNVIQSKIAIGSAGLWGKGFQMGTQTQLKFLPEVQSDFLFAAFVEEWGLLAGILVVLTFLLIIFRMVIIGSRARSNDFKFIALGGGLVLLIHFFINIGSNLGLLPVAGMPFPFLSYGGSSLLTNAILISIIQHIKLESAF